MPEFTSIQVQSMLRQMDVSMRKHRKLKKENHSKYIEKIQEENLQVLSSYYPKLSWWIQVLLSCYLFYFEIRSVYL